MVYACIIDLLNTVLGAMENVYHESWSGEPSVYEFSKLKSFCCNIDREDREQTVAKDSSSYLICGATCFNKIWLHLESYILTQA